MWSKWEERFRTFGARRIEFQTYKQGGARERGIKTDGCITGAKCLMFFEYPDPTAKEKFENNLFEDIIDKTVCSEILQVVVLKEEDFRYQIKDPQSGNYYGKKRGHPTLQFFPPVLSKSKGRDKVKSALIMARVFNLKKHQQRSEDGRRRTICSHQETNGIVIAAHLKGAWWGGSCPPDDEERKPEKYHSQPRYFAYDAHWCRCVYDFHTPTQVRGLISNYESSTFTRWKRFRGVGFANNGNKKADRSSKSIYDISEYTMTKLQRFGNNLLEGLKEKGIVNRLHRTFYYPGIGVCINLRNARMLCHRAFIAGHSINNRQFFTKSSDCESVLDIGF